jgi:hypothetical protein
MTDRLSLHKHVCQLVDRLLVTQACQLRVNGIDRLLDEPDDEHKRLPVLVRETPREGDALNSIAVLFDCAECVTKDDWCFGKKTRVNS